MPRTISTGVAVATLSASALVGMATSAAAAVTATPYVLGGSLGLSTDSKMVAAGGHLYVSQGHAGSDVVVFDLTGHKVADIAGQSGASGMVASPDGSTLYVALSSTDKISVIDTATQAETSRITVNSCPSSLTWSAGRLFYSYGCDSGQWTSGVASVDTANPATPPVPAIGSQYSPPLLAGTATRLVVGTLGLSPAAVTAYAVAVDGSVTAGATNSSSSNLQDLAVTPDGANVLVASGAPYQITQLALPAMTQSMVFAGVPYPKAVAVSPDGSRVAAGFNAFGDGVVDLYDAATGTLLWKRYGSTGVSASGAWAKPNVSALPGGLTFSPDGSTVLALVDDGAGHVSLFRSTLAPAKTTLSVSVPSVAYGKPLKASATLGGIGSGKVTFTRTSNGATKTLATVSTSAGVASTSFTSTYSGSVRALFRGDSAHLPATASRAYTTASKSSIAMSGYYKTVNGVRWYKSYSKVHATITVAPRVTGRKVTTGWWRYGNGSWHRIQTLTGYTDADGHLFIYLKSAPTHTRLRFTVSFAGDSFNRASKATGQTFEIG